MSNIMRKLMLSIALLAILTPVAEARMYQWTDIGSGNVQLSGSPPSWYRGAQGGPRTLVFDNGELVDDTAVQVPESQRIYLRDNAFGEDAGEEVATAEEVVKDELKAAMEKAQESGVDVEAVTSEFNQEQEELAAAVAPDAAEDLAGKVAALKSLIEVWDQRQLDQARSILDLLPEQASPPNVPQ
jgi:hypothetical protein